MTEQENTTSAQESTPQIQLKKPLEKMTAKELRELALGIEGIVGVHGMNKQELITAIKDALGIVEETGKKLYASAIREIKQKIRELKAEKERARAAGDKKRVEILRRRINRLKKKTRRLAAAS